VNKTGIRVTKYAELQLMSYLISKKKINELSGNWDLLLLEINVKSYWVLFFIP